jgi:hypothetical protein
VLDISDPSRLTDESIVGSWPSEYALSIEVVDNVAFVANGRRGLSIVDISPIWDDDPLNQPDQIGSHYTGGTAYRAVFWSDLLLVADGREGLKILDVSEPTNPVDIGSVTTDDARDVAVISGYALVADGRSGLIVCDISNPSNPLPINTLERRGVYKVVVQNAQVATAGRSGVEIFDFSDPLAPRSVGRFDSSYVENIYIDGRYLYIAEGYRGLKVLDIQSFDRPVAVSACPDIYAVDVVAQGAYSLVADSEQIHVIEVLIPEWLRQTTPR